MVSPSHRSELCKFQDSGHITSENKNQISFKVGKASAVKLPETFVYPNKEIHRRHISSLHSSSNPIFSAQNRYTYIHISISLKCSLLNTSITSLHKQDKGS